jgi:hypothetical protein
MSRGLSSRLLGSKDGLESFCERCRSYGVKLGGRTRGELVGGILGWIEAYTLGLQS